MRRLVLIVVALFGLAAAPRAEAAVITYDLTLTPTIGSLGGFGTLQFSSPFDPIFQNISPSTTTPNVDLFTITIGGETFDLTNTFTNIQVINGVFTNFGTSVFQNGIVFGSSDTTYTFFNLFTQAAAIGQISAQPHISAAVPEPATWAMMILGFAVLSAMVYRKKRRVTLAAAG